MPIDETKNKRLVIVVSQDTAAEIEALAKKDGELLLCDPAQGGTTC